MTKRFLSALVVGTLAMGCADGGNGGGLAGAGGGPTATGGHGGGTGNAGGAFGGTSGRGGEPATGGSAGGGAGGVATGGSAGGAAGGVATGGVGAAGAAGGLGGSNGGMAGGRGGEAGSAGAAAAGGGAGGFGGGGSTPSRGELSICTDFRAREGARPGTLSFDLGHTSAIGLVRVAGDRILSQEAGGHWILWNSTSKNSVLSGEAATALDLAGTVLAVTMSATAAEVRSATDGQLLASLTLPNGPLHVGPDAGYVWSAGTTALRAWTAGGVVLVDVAGDYSQAAIAAVSGELRVALGPAGASVIERITVGTSARATTPFSASFAAWFDDGEHFIAHTGDTVFIDALDGTQLQVVQFPVNAWMTAGGWGNYFWTAPATGTIYAIGSATPIGSPLPLAAPSSADVPGHLVFDSAGAYMLAFTASSVTEVNLSLDNVAPPYRFGVSPQGHWAAGTSDGRLFDSRSPLPSPSSPLPRPSLTCGTMLSLDGAPTGDAAISVSTQQIVMARFGTAGTTSPPYRLNTPDSFNAASVELTSDGQTLALSRVNHQYLSGTDQLFLLSLPTGTILSSWAVQGLGAWQLRIAGGGGMVSYIEDINGTRLSPVVRTFQPVADVYPAVPNTGHPDEVPLLAPGGQTFAIVSPDLLAPTTRIFKRDGSLVTAVNGAGAVWMDDNRLLTVTFGATPSGHLYDAMGNELGTVNLPNIGGVQAVGSDGIYSTAQNSIYSVISGSVTWTGSFPAAVGTVAGGYVLYLDGHEVIAERH